MNPHPSFIEHLSRLHDVAARRLLKSFGCTHGEQSELIHRSHRHAERVKAQTADDVLDRDEMPLQANEPPL